MPGICWSFWRKDLLLGTCPIHTARYVLVCEELQYCPWGLSEMPHWKKETQWIAVLYQKTWYSTRTRESMECNARSIKLMKDVIWNYAVFSQNNYTHWHYKSINLFNNSHTWMIETAKLCTSTWGRSSDWLCPSQSVLIL